MFSCGFIFLNFDYCRLKPFNLKNLEYYQNKILLAKFGFLSEYDEIDSHYSKIKLYNTDKKLTKVGVIKKLKELYNLDKKDILDYTPISRSYLAKQCKQYVSLFIIQVRDIDKLIPKISSHKLTKNISLMMYDLNSIPDNLDLAQSILNYDKKKTYSLEPMHSFFKTNDSDSVSCIKISKTEILKSLRGSVAFNDNIKTYICKLT